MCEYVERDEENHRDEPAERIKHLRDEGIEQTRRNGRGDERHDPEWQVEPEKWDGRQGGAGEIHGSVNAVADERQGIEERNDGRWISGHPQSSDGQHPRLDHVGMFIVDFEKEGIAVACGEEEE